MSWGSNEPVDLGKGDCEAETEKAILVYLDSTNEKHWIPKSQVHDNSSVWKKGDRGTVVVTEWFANKEGLGNE